MKFTRYLNAILLALLFAAGNAWAFDCQWVYRDGASNVLAIRIVELQAIAPYGTSGNNLITSDRIRRTNDSAGSLIVSNLFNGRSYRVTLKGPFIDTTITNSFDTNVTGLVNGADPAYLTAPIRDGSLSAYSQTASDARYIRGILASGATTNANNVVTLTGTGEGGGVTNNQVLPGVPYFPDGAFEMHNAGGPPAISMGRVGHGTNEFLSSDGFEMDLGGNNTTDFSFTSNGLASVWGFIGDLVGNADTATAATYANNLSAPLSNSITSVVPEFGGDLTNIVLVSAPGSSHNFYSPSWPATNYLVTGGNLSTVLTGTGSVFWNRTNEQSGAGGPGFAKAATVAITWLTDEREPIIKAEGTGPIYDIVVDDVDVYHIGQLSLSTASHPKLQFATAKWRKIQVLSPWYFGGVYIAKTNNWAVPPAPSKKLLIIGDSYFEQQDGHGASQLTPPARVIQAGLGPTWDVLSYGQSGTGWSNSYTGGATNFWGRLADIIRLKPDALAYIGGFNDTPYATSTSQNNGIFKNATNSLNLVRIEFPNIPIFVIGPQQVTTVTDATINNTATLLSTACALFNNVTYENPCSEPWINGTNTVAGSGNATVDIYSDGVHLTTAGQIYFAKKILKVIKPVLDNTYNTLNASNVTAQSMNVVKGPLVARGSDDGLSTYVGAFSLQSGRQVGASIGADINESNGRSTLTAGTGKRMVIKAFATADDTIPSNSYDGYDDQSAFGVYRRDIGGSVFDGGYGVTDLNIFTAQTYGTLGLLRFKFYKGSLLPQQATNTLGSAASPNDYVFANNFVGLGPTNYYAGRARWDGGTNTIRAGANEAQWIFESTTRTNTIKSAGDWKVNVPSAGDASGSELEVHQDQVQFYADLWVRLAGGIGGSLTVDGTATANLFSGSGLSLTALNASSLGSGTVDPARLPVAAFTNSETLYSPPQGATYYSVIAGNSLFSGFGGVTNFYRYLTNDFGYVYGAGTVNTAVPGQTAFTLLGDWQAQIGQYSRGSNTVVFDSGPINDLYAGSNYMSTFLVQSNIWRLCAASNMTVVTFAVTHSRNAPQFPEADHQVDLYNQIASQSARALGVYFVNFTLPPPPDTTYYTDLTHWTGFSHKTIVAPAVDITLRHTPGWLAVPSAFEPTTQPSVIWDGTKTTLVCYGPDNPYTGMGSLALAFSGNVLNFNQFGIYSTATGTGLVLGFNADTYRVRTIYADGLTLVNNRATFTDGITTGGANINTPSTRSGAGAVPITASLCALTTTGGAQALTLANGVAGQVLTIVHDVDGGSAVLTPSTSTGWSTVTFTSAGESVSLVYLTTRGWMVTGSYLAVIAP